MRKYILISLLTICCYMIFSCKKSSSTPGCTTCPNDSEYNVTIIAPKSVTKTNSQKVYVHYMPWFETPSTSPDGKWGSHWTMNNENPDIVVDGKRQIAAWFYPLIGPYASSDPDVIDYHTLLMKYAGIDGVIVDWGGSHNVYDYPLLRRNTDSLFNHMPKVGLHFAVCYEDATLKYVKSIAGIDTIPAAQQDFTYLQEKYFDSSSYTKINDRPLVLCFGPQVMHTEDQWLRTFSVLDQQPTFIPLWYASDFAGSAASGEFPWVSSDYLPGLQNYYQNRAPYLSIAFACAYPGFKDYYLQGGWGSNLFVIDHNGTTTLQNTLDLAQNSGLPYIQLITWNDFGEGTMIEPTTDFQYSFLQTIQQYTGVSYTQDELQLIYQWFMLRKKYKSKKYIEGELTQAYYYLVSLDVDKARSLISSIQ